MKALTIDAYWAWAIAHGDKRVENRGWRTKYRGPLLIHAGRNTSRDQSAIEFLRPRGWGRGWSRERIEHLRGRVIAVVDLVGCLPVDHPCDSFLNDEFSEGGTIGADPFAFGPECWILDNVRPLPEPIPAKGMQGLWNPPAEVLAAVQRQLEPAGV